jgi:hypothetical protein
LQADGVKRNILRAESGRDGSVSLAWSLLHFCNRFKSATPSGLPGARPRTRRQ